ncbi:MAG: response regulator [Deltaproteobacteria bacterium]|nr:response regulator [Deltaproteobacteria bacterium]
MMQESRQSMYILIIDDDDRVRTLLSNILKFAGHRVIEASDGDSGIRCLEEGESVDMVLTDLGMPLKNGWEVTKWIKAKTPQLPVILVTGWGTGLDEEKIKESGVDLVIKKPFEVNEILETVDLFTKIAKRSSSSTVAGHFLKQE